MADHKATKYWFRGTPAEFGAIAEDLARQKRETDPDLPSSIYHVIVGLEPIQNSNWAGYSRRRIMPDANPVQILIEYWNGLSWADAKPGGPLAHGGTMTVIATAIPGNGTRLRLGPVRMAGDPDRPQLYNTDPAPVLALWDDLLAELVRLDLIDDGETTPPAATEPKDDDLNERQFYNWAYVEIEMKGRSSDEVFEEYMEVVRGIDVWKADAMDVQKWRNNFDSAMSARRGKYSG